MNNENQHKRVEKIQGIAKIRKQDLLENYQKQKKKHDKSIEFGDCLEEEIDKLRDKNKKEKNIQSCSSF